MTTKRRKQKSKPRLKMDRLLNIHSKLQKNVQAANKILDTQIAALRQFYLISARGQEFMLAQAAFCRTVMSEAQNTELAVRAKEILRNVEQARACVKDFLRTTGGLEDWIVDRSLL